MGLGRQGERQTDLVVGWAELTGDKGYHSRDRLKDLEDGPWKSRIGEKKGPGVHRWHGDDAARRAVYNNRARLRSGTAKEAFRLRAKLVERSFGLTLDRGGMRRAWLRREHLHERAIWCTSPATISA